ncbi:MAG: DNA mismatch repair endonuclease MutL [Bacteroidales bacterium]|jgi:DNA mismatch repair protein MutL|nr:DNA mismatch repair endonuclease MutL [Bacteroidales bacterium]
MSGIIKILPEHIANQIAAGEVVTRPASAVKELLENAIDAGATEIQLYIEDAGKTLIHVIDNGTGMGEEDAKTAFIPHATSKITNADDLQHISTMGFRGEALASIASVAQIELKTRRDDDELGTQIEIDGGNIKSTQPIATPKGTNISVKNIYFNTPARRKFLLSDDAEFRYIEDTFTKISLAHPEVSFSLYKNNCNILFLPIETQYARIIKIFGNNFQQRLVRIDENLSDVSIHGYICKPGYVTKRRNKQYLFVNKRIIKHAGLNYAIESAFTGLIPEKNYPIYCIFIGIDTSAIDVNIHPSKTEIRFNNEKLVYGTLQAVVKHSIGIHQLSPSLDFNTFQLPHKYSNSSDFSKTSSDFREAYLRSVSEIHRTEMDILQKDIESLQSELPLHEPQLGSPMKEDDNVFQIVQSYIAAPLSSGFLLLDQHAASERILFDEYCAKKKSSEKTPSRRLLFPQSITVSSSQVETLKDIQPDLEFLGWDFSWIGDNSFMINAMPENAARDGEEDAQKIIEDILDVYVQRLMSGGHDMSGRDKVAAAMAKRSAVKYGEKLHKEEMLSIIARIFSSAEPHISPSGQKTFRIISPHELSQLLLS